MTIGIIPGGPLGAALADRLITDGREVLTATGGAELRALAARVRLVVVDADPAGLRSLAVALGEVLDGNHLVAHTVRGLAADGVSATEVLLKETAVRRIGVVAGPLEASALSSGRPAAAVIASRHPEVVEEFAAALSTPRLRIYRSRDPLGVELAGGVCDLITVGCGVIQALGFGDTARAVLIVRAVRELERLIVAVGGEPGTASGLSGLGDILVRSANPESTAFRLGVALAAGRPEPRAELLETARTLRTLAARTHVTAHIFDGLVRLLHSELSPSDLATRLMTLPILDD